MGFQPDPDVVRWRLHLRSPTEDVWDLITTDAGRERFWVERSRSDGDAITLEFPNGQVATERVLRLEPPHHFAITYLGSEAAFTLEGDGSGGTDLLLEDRGVASEHRNEVTAGWLNVLFPLKAVADHGIDLRNHDGQRTWDGGWVDG